MPGDHAASKLGLLRWMLSFPADAPRAWRQYRQLARSQWWDRAQLAASQAEKLHRLYTLGISQAPYYRDRVMPPAWQSEDGAVADWLRQWSILQKEDVRRHGNEMLSPLVPEKSRRFATTGGSTGEPLRVAKSLQSVAVGDAALLRGQSWAGIFPGDRGLTAKAFGHISLPGQLRQALANRMSISAFEETESGSKVIERVARFRPRFVTGYPTSLIRLAEQVGEGRLEIPVIFSTGEMLHPSQRGLLEQTFQGRVFDYYGCNEVGSLAYECEHGRRHITEEHVIFETVNNAGEPVSGVPGRILITDLDNHALPLIRYDVGDIGVLSDEQCPCGRSLRVLASLEGRTQDMLRSRSGRSLPAIFFSSQFRALAGLKAYQLIQKSWDAVDLRYVVGGPGAIGEVEAIAAEITRRLGSEVTVEAHECADIPLTARGKTRLIVGYRPPEL